MSEYNQEQIATEIAELLSSDRFLDALMGKTGGASSGGSLVIKSNGRQISAIAVGEVPPGDCVALKDTKTGKWYAVSSYGEGKNNEYLIRYRRWRQPENDIVYSVIALIGIEADIDFLPNTENHTEFWLTGGKYRQKRIDTLNDSSNRYDSRFSSNIGFLTNSGNGKYYVASDVYIKTRNNVSGGYLESRILKFFKNNVLSTIFIDKNEMAQDLYYQGNGIWQGVVANGIYQGVGDVEDDGGQVITPDRGNKNFVVHNGLLFKLLGNLSFETIINTPLEQLIVGFQNRSIQHETYLPNGNSTFTYNAVRSGSLPEFTYTETMAGELLTIAWNKQYITQSFSLEQISTLTQKYPNATPETTDYFKGNLSSCVTSRTQEIKLRTFGDSEETKTIALDSNSKFLVIPMKPVNPITDNTEVFNVNYTDNTYTPLARVYYEDIADTDENPFNFIGENIITSYAIDNKKPYLIRGIIQSINLIPVTVNGNNLNKIVYVISIKSKQRLPKAVYRTQSSLYKELEGTWGLPLNDIILDNGCFWNYWIAAQNTGFFGNGSNIEVNYQNLYYNSSFSSSFANLYGGFWQVISDGDRSPDSVYKPVRGFIHTNPISGHLARGLFYPAFPVLLTDNLVNNKIYSVRNSYTLQDYYNLLNGDGLNEQVIYSEIPVAQWDITPDGKIKYKNTFLTPYEMTIPYFEGTPKILTSGITVPLGYSYHPK